MEEQDEVETREEVEAGEDERWAGWEEVVEARGRTR
jgi:hypothetical protein